MSNFEPIVIQLLDNEYWWGGIVAHGHQMPYDAGSNIREELFGNIWGNQACPLLVSSKGRYVWSEEPFAFEFKDGRLTIDNIRSKIELGEGQGSLRGSYLAACGKFFPPSGKTPNELSFTAPQYNAWIDMLRHPTQEKVLKYAQAILDAGMPPGVLVIDDWWHRNNGTWRFDKETFPDPKAMVDRLHKQGFLVMVWLTDYVTPDTREFLFLKDKGFIFADEKKAPLIERWWNGYGAILDLSNPGAFAWMQEQMDELVRQFGIDGFKLDGGDPFHYRNVKKSFEPRTPNGHCEDFVRLGMKYDLAEFRACWKFGGQHLMQRVRDKYHGWSEGGFADIIPSSLAQGIMGYPYSCPDMVGGGEDTDFLSLGTSFEQELFVRWAQCSTFFPIIQYSNLPSRVLGGEPLKIVLELVKLRMKLGPEILELARQAARTGEPIMRYMAYVFPGEGIEAVIDQYMLGDKYLVAPVMAKGATSRKVKFPHGSWRGDDGNTVTGPCEMEVQAPLARLPWYARV
jgi:alpha-glucosidase (family GH31 glycosyl hydrolase)